MKALSEILLCALLLTLAAGGVRSTGHKLLTPKPTQPAVVTPQSLENNPLQPSSHPNQGRFKAVTPEQGKALETFISGVCKDVQDSLQSALYFATQTDSNYWDKTQSKTDFEQSVEKLKKAQNRVSDLLTTEGQVKQNLPERQALSEEIDKVYFDNKIKQFQQKIIAPIENPEYTDKFSVTTNWVTKVTYGKEGSKNYFNLSMRPGSYVEALKKLIFGSWEVCGKPYTSVDKKEYKSIEEFFNGRCAKISKKLQDAISRNGDTEAKTNVQNTADLLIQAQAKVIMFEKDIEASKKKIGTFVDDQYFTRWIKKFNALRDAVISPCPDPTMDDKSLTLLECAFTTQEDFILKNMHKSDRKLEAEQKNFQTPQTGTAGGSKNAEMKKKNAAMLEKMQADVGKICSETVEDAG